MEIWTCGKMITTTHKVVTVPEKIRLKEVAECGSVLVQIGDEYISCIELDPYGKESSGVGESTLFISVEDVKIGDEIKIMYFPRATENIGDAVEYQMSTIRLDQPRYFYDDLAQNAKPRYERTLILEFDKTRTACKLAEDMCALVIRNHERSQSIFVELRLTPSRADIELVSTDIREDEETSQFSATIEVDYFWTCEYHRKETEEK